MVGSSLALPPGLFHEDQNQSPFLCAIAFLSMTLSSLEEPLLSPWESLYQPALGGTHLVVPIGLLCLYPMPMTGPWLKLYTGLLFRAPLSVCCNYKARTHGSGQPLPSSLRLGHAPWGVSTSSLCPSL